MLILYAVPQSPFCAKVRGALRFKGIEFEEHEPAGGSYQTTEYQETVAAGSVPAIRRGDWVLHDSQAIIEYLEESFTGRSLWSADAEQRATQRACLNYHDSKLQPAVRALVPLAGSNPSAERTLDIGLAHDRLFDRLYRMDRILEASGWHSKPTDCPADWTIPCTVATAIDLLGFLDCRLTLPGGLNGWLDLVRRQEIVTEQVALVRGAIGVWLERQCARMTGLEGNIIVN